MFDSTVYRAEQLAVAQTAQVAWSISLALDRQIGQSGQQ